MSGECNLCGWIGHTERYCPTLRNQGPPNADVPLENQTKECLIALVESMDKQAKDNDKRRAALQKVASVSKDLRFWEQSTNSRSAGMTGSCRRVLDRRLLELDALTPTQEKN